MSTTVDNRVLEMRFDNAQFEKGVSTSMSTLDKLKKKLNLSGASKGLESLEKASKNVKFSGLLAGVDAVNVRFSHMQMSIQHQLDKIVDSCFHAGKKMTSALTIDPIKSGFQEYETQIGSIQTILSNTRQEGTNVDIVNRALDELNTYADKTIYNFTEMTRNIGTFTAAGVKLDTSVNAIKGIANLAAVSGSTSQQASTAMYQLSQALAAGKVSLMDWNSVVNAGMGGKVFQDALVRTSELLGTGAKDAIDSYGSFRESLTKGEWLTTKVLTETLNQLSGAYSKADLMSQGFSESQADEIMALAKDAEDAATKVKTFTQLIDTVKESLQSGWGQTWRILVGDFEDSKELFTGISDAIGKMVEASSKSRNELMEGAMTSNWDKLVKKINEAGTETNIFEEKIKSVAKSHNVDIDAIVEKYGSMEKAFQSGAISTDILKESVNGLNNGLTDLAQIQRILEKGNTGDDVKSVQEALKSLDYDIGENGADGVFGSATEEAVKAFQKASGLTADGIIGSETISALQEAAKTTDELSGSVTNLIDNITELGGRTKLIESFKNIWVALKQVFGPIRSAFRQVFPPATAEYITSLIDKFQDFTEKLKISRETAEKIRLTFKGLFSIIDIGIEGIKAITKGFFNLVGKFTGLGGGVLSVTSSIGKFLSTLRNSIVEGNLFGKTVDKIVNFISGGIDKAKEFGSSLKDSMSVSSTFQGFLGFFNGVWNVIKNIGSAIATAFSGIGSTIAEAFGKGDIFEVINSGLFAGILLSVRNFIKGLSDPFEKIDFLSNAKDILDDVKGSLESWQSNLKAGTLLKIASAIGILAVSLFVISGIDDDKLGSSLGAIGGLFLELVSALAVLEKINSKSIKPLSGIVSSLSGIARTVQMIGFGASIFILAGAMKIIAGIDWNGVAKGLAGIGGMVTIFVAAAKLMNTESKSITKFAGQMVILSAAIAALSGVAKILGFMSWEELAKGGSGILGIVVILVGAAKIMNTENRAITKFAGQMLVMSTAIAVLAGISKILGSMSWSELGKAGAGILGIVTIIVTAAKIMSTGSKSIAKFGGQMILIASALAILAPVMKSLGTMSWETIGKGLIVIGASLIELSIGLHAMRGTIKGSAALFVVATGLGVLTPVLMALGSMSWESIAKGLVVLAGAFAVIGIAGALLSPLAPALLGVSAAMGVFALAIAGLGVGIFALAAGFTMLATAGAAGAVSFIAALTTIITGILGLIPEIAQVIGRGIVEVAKVIGEYAPQLADSFLKFILGVLQSLETNAPQIVDSILGFMIGIINSLAEHTPELISAVINFVSQVVKGVVDAIGSLDMDTMMKGIGAFGVVGLLMKVFSGVGTLAGSAMTGVLAVGAVIAEIAVLLAAIGGLSKIPGFSSLIEEGGGVLGKIGNAIGTGIGAFIGGIGEGITGSLPQMGQDISDFMENLSTVGENASKIKAGSFDGVSDLISTLGRIGVNTVGTTISDIFTLGGTSMEKFQTDGVAFFNAMKAISAASMGVTVDESSMSAIIGIASQLAGLQSSLEPIGGVMSWFKGRDDLSTFGENAGEFINSMKTAFANLGDIKINEESITSIVGAATKLAELQSSLENMGGVIEWFTGENNLGTFGERIGQFATAMGTLKTNMGENGITETTVTSITNAGNALVGLQEALPKEGWFDGKLNLTDFSNYITDFSDAIGELGTMASELNPSAISTAISAAYNMKYLIEAISDIDTSGVSEFTGIGTGLRGADGPMTDIGKAIAEFCKTVDKINPTKVETSVSVALRLRSLIASLTSLDTSGIENFKIATIGNSIKNYGNSVKDLDPGVVASSVTSAIRLKDFISSLAGLDTSGVSTFTSAVSSLSKSNINGLLKSFSGASGELSNAGSDLLSSVSKGMISEKSSLSSAATVAITAAQNAITSKGATFIKAGSTLISKMVSGFNSQKSKVISAVTSSISQAVSKIAGYYGSFYTNGRYLGDGLVSGINSKKTDAYNAGYNLGQAAVQGEKDGQKSKSPSKLTEKAGKWLGEGLVIGIEKMGRMVYNTGYSLGDRAANSISKSISKVSDMVDTGMNATPTIRPVLDLSNIESGAGEIGSLFDINPSVGVLSNLNSIGSSMNRRNQNGRNDDVVSAIDKLRKELGNVGNTSYNINGITYDDGSAISEAVETLVRAAKIGRRR